MDTQYLRVFRGSEGTLASMEIPVLEKDSKTRDLNPEIRAPSQYAIKTYFPIVFPVCNITAKLISAPGRKKDVSNFCKPPTCVCIANAP